MVRNYAHKNAMSNSNEGVEIQDVLMTTFVQQNPPLLSVKEWEKIKKYITLSLMGEEAAGLICGTNYTTRGGHSKTGEVRIKVMK